MNILHVIPVYEPAYIYGGPVSSVSQLCRSLAALGARVSVFTTNANGSGTLDVPTDVPVDVGGVTVWYFARGGLLGIGSRALAAACSRESAKFDLIHVTGMWQRLAVPACRSARRAGTPYIVSARGGFNPWAWRRRRLKKLFYWHLFERRNFFESAAVHFTAEEERANAAGLLPRRCPNFVVPNGVNLERLKLYPDKVTEFRRQLPIPADAKVLLYIGRIHPAKGLDLLIGCMDAVRSRCPAAHLVLLGPRDSGEYSRLAKLCSEARLDNCVHFLPGLHGEDLPSAYGAADLFAFPSHGENFGMSAVEAMSCGLPVIVSEQVNIASDIEKAGAGVRLAREPRLWAETILELLHNPDRRSRMAERARRAARDLYDLPKVARLMLRAYEDVLHGARSPECRWSGPIGGPALKKEGQSGLSAVALNTDRL
jgi:glycosyltransferase involved in cell wall biosynthesis